jgi:hypothetical protein
MSLLALLPHSLTLEGGQRVAIKTRSVCVNARGLDPQGSGTRTKDPEPDPLPHPTTYTLHPAPYTLHPTPCTLRVSGLGLGFRV